MGNLRLMKESLGFHSNASAQSSVVDDSDANLFEHRSNLLDRFTATVSEYANSLI
jgi:hypothetical protein